MSHLKFSIATPSRNALPNLRRCVGSIRGQQGAWREHLVQDALSTDGTDAWLALQPDLSARCERDAGMYDAINRAWSRAQGDILSWLNCDEQYLPGTLARVAEAFDAHAEVDVVSGDFYVVDPDGRPVAVRQEIPFRRAYVVNGFLNTASCALFFRRRLLDRGGLRFDPALRYAGDTELMVRLHDSGVRFMHLAQPLSLFGLSGENLSARPECAAEIAALNLMLGGFRSPVLARSVMLGRRLERLLRGAYRRRPVAYRFATDEVPNYVEVRAPRVGGRYALSDTAHDASVTRCDT